MTVDMSTSAANTSNNAGEYVLIGMGNPLLDMIIEIDTPELLHKYKLKENDAILADESHKALYAEMAEKHKVEYLAGGATQNVIRGAQTILPPKSTVFIGCVGDDEYAATQRKAAEESGLRVEYLVDKDHRTGTCAVICHNAHRSLVANVSAADHYKISHLESKGVWSLIEQAKYYYISGFFVTNAVPSILKVAEHAAASNKVLAQNLSAAFVCQFFKDALVQLAPYWDIIFGNEGEAEAYAQSFGLKSTDVKEVALHLYNLPKKNTSRSRLVVLTQGPLPTVVVQDGKVTEFPTPVIPSSEIVDTNGAGDAFCGGFLAHYIKGDSVQACVAAGQALAGAVIRQSGCKFPKKA